MNVLSTVAAIFVLLLVGYAARKFNVLKGSDTLVVNSVVVNITGPAFAFMAIYGKPLTTEMIRPPIVLCITSLIVLTLAYILAKALRFDRRTTGGVMLAAAFGNTGFLGYPVTIAAFPGQGEALSTAVITDQFGMALPLYSVGVAVAATFASTKINNWQVLEFLKAPLFIATVLAILLRSVAIPAVLVTSLELLAAATVPLAMISIGLSISGSSLKMARVPFMVAAILKMVVLPVLAYVGLILVGTQGVVRDVGVIEAAMPSAIMTSVIASRYGANGAFVSGATFLMTLGSILTIPAILSILG
ncbi:MAG TPA: AEC family transporter [Armatimonadota bacterium]|nr:AEC family transporter [Armatimonadota bacterium]